ncbi:MAG TPA: Fe-S cluster assembly protein SufD [Bacilli bacterium]|nr:Fe-S cluster assembly protein SufD [Bacilli bacterium]
MIDSAKTLHEQIAMLSRFRIEPKWLRDLRQQALTHYEQLPDVTWEKSSLQARPTGPFFPTAMEQKPMSEHVDLDRHFRHDTRNLVLFDNEKIVEHRMQAHLARKGVLLTGLSLAVRIFPKRIEPYFGQLLPHTTNKWLALQTALFNAGAFLYVPRHVKVSVPMQVWWRRTSGGGLVHPRLLVVAEEGAEVTLLTGEVSELEEPAFSVLATEVIAKQGARVKILSLQEQDPQMTRLSFARAHLEKDAEVNWVYADAGESYSIQDFTSVLHGDGARTTLDAVCLNQGRAHLDLTQTAAHIGRYTESRMQGRGIVGDQARAFLRSVSKIEKGAVGTSSTQEERLLLLNKEAQAHAVPMLLIDEEDVSCDHALSVGKLNDEHLFYLMARGLTEAEAKRLLLRGFLSPVVEATGMEGVRLTLYDWLEKKVKL